eukprot:TRINITY_DN7333_c0_g1_i11.p1 TRINITY_DN7333_c0_g1~~TRINITY_DN7333_c0_g1_i11.p1  ORF type:complete len:408 (-),score=44.13 TRINITY_DN7333_c0_g1_i11:670-1893(-)
MAQGPFSGTRHLFEEGREDLKRSMHLMSQKNLRQGHQTLLLAFLAIMLLQMKTTTSMTTSDFKYWFRRRPLVSISPSDLRRSFDVEHHHVATSATNVTRSSLLWGTCPLEGDNSVDALFSGCRHNIAQAGSQVRPRTLHIQHNEPYGCGVDTVHHLHYFGDFMIQRVCFLKRRQPILMCGAMSTSFGGLKGLCLLKGLLYFGCGVGRACQNFFFDKCFIELWQFILMWLAPYTNLSCPTRWLLLEGLLCFGCRVARPRHFLFFEYIIQLWQSILMWWALYTNFNGLELSLLEGSWFVVKFCYASGWAVESSFCLPLNNKSGHSNHFARGVFLWSLGLFSGALNDNMTSTAVQIFSVGFSLCGRGWADSEAPLDAMVGRGCTFSNGVRFDAKAECVLALGVDTFADGH